MTLDEPNENDFEITENGLAFMVDRAILIRFGRIKVDYVEDTHWTGFAIFPEKPAAAGC